MRDRSATEVRRNCDAIERRQGTKQHTRVSRPESDGRVTEGVTEGCRTCQTAEASRDTRMEARPIRAAMIAVFRNIEHPWGPPSSFAPPVVLSDKR
eukprot:724759-Prorocentrum_minimum.AAC.1